MLWCLLQRTGAGSPKASYPCPERGSRVSILIIAHRRVDIRFKAVALDIMGSAGVSYGVEDADRAADTENSVADEHRYRRRPASPDLIQ